MSLIRKLTTSQIADGRTCVISNLERDAMDDVVGDSSHPTLGWSFDDYMKNPVVLWSHNSKEPPIGKMPKVWVENGAVMGKLVLAPLGVSPFVDQLRALLDAGILKGISAGFRPTKSQPLPSGGTHWLRQSLIEVSLCATPANPSALVAAKKLGIDNDLIKKIFVQGNHLDNAMRIAASRASVRRAKATLARTGFQKKPKLLEASSEAKQKAADRMKKDQHNMEVHRKAKALLARLNRQHEIERHPETNPNSPWFKGHNKWAREDPDARWRGVKVRQPAPDRFRVPRQGWNTGDDDDK